MKTLILILTWQLLSQAYTYEYCDENSPCSSIFQTCNNSTSSCIEVVCEGHENCTSISSSSICRNETCVCQDGYSQQNGECTKVLGRTCISSNDCGTDVYTCFNGTCNCNLDWYDKDGICVPLLGKECTASKECIHDQSYDRTLWCEDGTCKCKTGYKAEGDICKRVIGSTCSSIGDCPLEYAECSGYCHCKQGTQMNNDQICIPVLGSSCSIVSCYWSNQRCNAENICTCTSGFIQDSLECVEVFGQPCQTKEDCGKYGQYICSTNETCACAPGSEIQTSYGGYRTCSSALHQSCNQTECYPTNAECNDDNICECIYGYFDEYGVCLNVLGASCVRDETCQVLNNTRCSLENKCECINGFKPENGLCVKVLQSECNSSEDCPTKDSSCLNGYCRCNTGKIEHNDICLRPECVQDVSKLNDLHRRGTRYKLQTFFDDDLNEPLIDDSYLAEGWYSLGVYSLATHNPGKGYCGTYRPIHLRGNLTNTQLDQMEHSEVNIQVSVNGGNELINVKLRICGSDTHLYIPAGLPRSSAFCIERNLISRGYSYNYYYSYIQTDLEFTDVFKDEQLWHVPYVLFYCDIRTSNSYDFRYMVNWYADNKHLVTYGPVNGSAVYGHDRRVALNENILLAAGYSIGVNLKCSVQALDSYTSTPSGELFSASYKTGLSTDRSNWYFFNWGNLTLIHPYHGTPLGCSSAHTDQSINCRLSFDIVSETGENICPKVQTSLKDKPRCGFSLLGRTFRHNGTYQDSAYENNDTSYRNVLLTDQLEDYNSSAFFRLSLAAKDNNAGHKLWENYIPSLQKIKPQIYLIYLDGYISYSGNKPILRFIYYPRYVEIPLETVGEFILLHEYSEYPFQIQVKTEFCHNDEYDTTICLCSITVRDGNDVSTFSLCGGILQNGFLTRSNTQQMDFPNSYISPSLEISMWTSQYSHHSLSMNIYIRANSTENIQGLWSARDDYYRWRSGAVYSHSEGFAESWRIEYDESLLNPDNHVDYAWRDTFYQCTCPDSSDNITDGQQSSGRYYEYIGAIKCSSNNLCFEDRKGKEWPATLFPSYYIDIISVNSNMQINEDSAILEFRCNFKTTVGYLYTIYWYLHGKLVKTCTAVSSAETSNCILTGNNILEYNNTVFVLEIQVTCGTMVLNANGSVILDVIKSHTSMVPVEVANNALNIARGGDANLLLRRNMTFNAEPSVEWAWEFTVYDMDDPNCTCQDSSIAVKSTTGDICGVRLSKSSPWQESTTHITLTTKNNNKYSLKDIFRLKLKTSLKVNGKRILNGEFSQEITVFVRDEEFWKRKVCYSNNDPQMKTFDETYWYMKHVGIFVMYRHRQLPVEVQLLIQSCNNGWATCSCGVIIRSERDVFIINHCHDDHMTGWMTPEYAEPRTFSPRQLDSSRYQFSLPYGTQVDVSISPWRWYMVNVNIFASPSDVNNVVGLCGEFNNNPADDFTGRDGIIDHSEDNKDWWWSWWRFDPNEFPKSWELAGQWENESLLDPSNVNNLPVNNKSDILCVCPWNHESETSICSANEAETCTVNKGLPDEDKRRKRRSIQLDIRPIFDLNHRLKEVRMKFKTESEHFISKRSTVSNSSISNDEALAICNTTLNSDCQAYARKAELIASDADGTLLNCAADTAFNPNISWSAESCSRMVVIAEMESERDVENENVNKTKSLIKEICVGNCSGNGVCQDGACKCNPGFLTDICFIDSSVPPTIVRVFGNGICNPTKDTCTCLPVVTTGNAETTTCNITILQAVRNEPFAVVETSIVGAVIHSLNEASCCYEYGPKRHKRSSEGDMTGYGVMMSLSNNNSTYGNSDYVFILDTQCQEIEIISGQHVLTLKSGYCYIEGACYAEGSTSETGCGQCDPESSRFNWIDVCVKTEEDKDNTQTIIIATIAAVVGVGLVLTTAFFVTKIYKSLRRKKVDPMQFNDPVKS